MLHEAVVLTKTDCRWFMFVNLVEFEANDTQDSCGQTQNNTVYVCVCVFFYAPICMCVCVCVCACAWRRYSMWRNAAGFNRQLLISWLPQWIPVIHPLCLENICDTWRKGACMHTHTRACTHTHRHTDTHTALEFSLLYRNSPHQ